MKVAALFCILVFILLLPVTLVMAAGIHTKTVQVKSQGLTHSEAVINGLTEAVQQVQGLQLEALREIQWRLRDYHREENNLTFSSTELSEEVLRDTRTKTQGIIDRYRILSLDKLDDGWQATMEVSVAVYRSPGDKAGMPSLGIMPFRARKGFLPSGGLNVQEIARQITQRLTGSILQSRRFLVLDREYGQEFEKERQLILDGNAPPRELARLGEMLGADYMLTGTISEAHGSISRREWHGVEIITHDISLSVELRLVEFATRQVKWSEFITIPYNYVERRPITSRSKGRTPANDSLNRFIPQLVEEASMRMNHAFFDVMVPVIVMDVIDGKVYLNQGGSRFRIGDRVTVESPPRELTDPSTGGIIKVDGQRLAEIEILEIADAYSIARVVNGRIKSIKRGLHCKRIY